MHILHIYKDYWPVLGGIENHVRLLAERQAARGHSVTVVVTSRQGHTQTEMLNGVRVIRAARLATVASAPLSLALPWHIARLRADIAHVHFPYPVGEVAQWLCGRARRTVVAYHSDVVRQRAWLRLYGPLMRHILRRADRIIASTPNYLASSPVLQNLTARCVVIPYGIAQERFRTPPAEAVRQLRARWGAGPVLLFVGVLRYYKGLRYLLEAMPNIPARLVIAGDGPLAPELRRQAQELGLGERVLFAGRVEDELLPAYYGAADLFVLPASERSEAFGLVQVEALAAGLPIVCTELGTGTSYVNSDGVSGLVTPPRDPTALAQAINRLLSDDALRARLAAGARQRAALFEVERMVQAIEELYRELLG